MSATEHPGEDPIAGWVAIAAAVGKATRSSVCERTARRYARQGRINRLPVFKFLDNGNVYLLPSHLVQWAANRSIPVGATLVGNDRKTPLPVVRRVRPCP